MGFVAGLRFQQSAVPLHSQIVVDPVCRADHIPEDISPTPIRGIDYRVKGYTQMRGACQTGGGVLAESTRPGWAMALRCARLQPNLSPLLDVCASAISPMAYHYNVLCVDGFTSC
jgi:hypothetical protein